MNAYFDIFTETLRIATFQPRRDMPRLRGREQGGAGSAREAGPASAERREPSRGR